MLCHFWMHHFTVVVASFRFSGFERYLLYIFILWVCNGFSCSIWCIWIHKLFLLAKIVLICILMSTESHSISSNCRFAGVWRNTAPASPTAPTAPAGNYRTGGMTKTKTNPKTNPNPNPSPRLLSTDAGAVISCRCGRWGRCGVSSHRVCSVQKDSIDVIFRARWTEKSANVRLFSVCHGR